MRFVNALLKIIVIMEILAITGTVICAVIYLLGGYTGTMMALSTMMTSEYIWIIITAIFMMLSIAVIIAEIIKPTKVKTIAMIVLLLLAAVGVLIGVSETSQTGGIFWMSATHG